MKKINLHNEFGNLIITREAIISLFNSLAHTNNLLVLDFSNIEFISRSATHEYIRQKLSNNIKLKEINMSQNVKSMFLLVTKQLKKITT
jgi:hypothetical protein